MGALDGGIGGAEVVAQGSTGNITARSRHGKVMRRIDRPCSGAAVRSAGVDFRAIGDFDRRAGGFDRAAVAAVGR